DYIHWNPVKHGWVRRVVDWPHSSFHQFVAQGFYPPA
ncbi:MAG: transposase, partial [Methyloglobulus sp.]|nr:transposase [Methyloglobulus sp.]